MKISTEIGSASALVGEEKAVELVAKAGFDGWDFSMFQLFRYDWTEKRICHSGPKPGTACCGRLRVPKASGSWPLLQGVLQSYLMRLIEKKQI